MPLAKRREIPLRVSDIMIKNVVVAKENDKIREVAAKMYENKVGSVVVIDDDGKPIGIVTERDMVYVVARSLPQDTPVWMVMAEDPVTINENALITEAMEKMRELNIKHLPVVDSSGKLVGMLAFRDIIDAASILVSLSR